MSRTHEPLPQPLLPEARSPYTIEGVIDGFGDFARGANRARGWQRGVAKVLALWMVAPIVIGAAILLGYGVFELVRALLP